MEEQVIIVDKMNEPVKAVSRSVMRMEVLLHRATYVIITNANDELLIQKRSVQKDVYPGYFDPTTGGVVQAGESYEVNAHRELEEELGIAGVRPVFLFDFHFEEANCKVWGRAFHLLYDGKIRMVDGEVTDYFFLKKVDIPEFIRREDVMPDGRYVVERYLGLLSNE